MSDNNAHPGVRSLLAKFENGQSPITSPPSRGRSPVCSDTPGSTRPLSRVRASFVTVDGVVQTNPGSPLRKTSGRSDTSSMFGPQINQEDVEARRQNVISPTPGGGLGDSQHGATESAAAGTQMEDSVKSATESKTTDIGESSAPRNEQAPLKTQDSSVNINTPAGSQAPSDKAGPKTVSKRPSNINGNKNNATSKSTSTAASTTTTSSTDNTATKQLSARELAKERSNALAHKSSRASLNPATKTSARTTRGPTPSKEISATSPTDGTATKRAKSPTKPVRLPASATAPTQASSARLGTGTSSAGRTGTTASTLTRKPSSLKSAAAGQTRTSTTASNSTTAGVRRQVSRPSLPVQSTHERPSSRASDVGTTRPLNEGFLARMMRPTESSRSKTHDKTDSKPAPKAPTVAKTPRLSSAKVTTAQPKPKVAASQPQNEKSQAAKVKPVPQKDDIKPMQQEQESEKNADAPPAVIPEEPISEQPILEQPEGIAVEQPEPEIPKGSEAPAMADDVEEPAKSIEEEADATSSPAQVVESTESSTDKVAAEAPAEELVESAADTDANALVDSNEKTNDTAASVETTQQPAETPAEPVLKEDETGLSHADDHVSGEQTTAEPAAEQTEEPAETTVASTVEVSTPAVEENIPQPEQETSNIPEASLTSESTPETQEHGEVSEPPVEPVQPVQPVQPVEETEPKDAAISESTETTEETPGERKPETVDLDVASLTLN